MHKQQFTALLYGWIAVLGLILVTSIVLSLLLQFTTMDQTVLSWVTLAAGLIILFIGGVIAGMKGKEKGWVIGAVTGLGFTLFTFLVQFLGYQQTFSAEQSLTHTGFILAALVGGVIGVNMVKGETT
ncbi:TIGR04086 family membrane protein [Lentibacillus cibarius]|uniref:TIGR04086 family membrane protein n=1 Tax=Lentibacillus cibarius TaxID=2583219 RepID=A0A5S3QGP4_9BACI|nr:TIGR04086 family membrane protein [Lentibacillus cibarius]TMN21060.1 TIGR04086 family membrane protein [Lentibacillus cibarius]